MQCHTVPCLVCFSLSYKRAGQSPLPLLICKRSKHAEHPQPKYAVLDMQFRLYYVRSYCACFGSSMHHSICTLVSHMRLVNKRAGHSPPVVLICNTPGPSLSVLIRSHAQLCTVLVLKSQSSPTICVPIL